MMNIKSFLAAAISTAGILTLSQPASAVVYNWQFTNENGNLDSPTDVVRGFVEFDDANVSPNATNVQATSFQITEVTDVNSSGSPGRFFGNGFGLELGVDFPIISVGPGADPARSSFSFDSNSEIVGSELFVDFIREREGGIFRDRERISLRKNAPPDLRSFINAGTAQGGSSIGSFSYQDNDSNTLTFSSASASVPFEFSPTLGIVLAGGFFAGSRFLKRRQNDNFIK